LREDDGEAKNSFDTDITDTQCPARWTRGCPWFRWWRNGRKVLRSLLRA
jgi:hypothetical protein